MNPATRFYQTLAKILEVKHGIKIDLRVVEKERRDADVQVS